METKHQKILRILEERARTSVVGSCFATEEKLCSEFGVSRMTVNKVICALVEKGLLYRIPLKGTFVKEPPKKSRHLVYLIPCPDAMVLDSWEAARNRIVYSGILRAARQDGIRLETLSISPVNSPTEIDFSFLDRIGRNSCVIVDGAWYAHVYERLNQVSDHILLIESGVEYTWKEQYRHTASWLISRLDYWMAAWELFMRFFNAGCRRICLMYPWLYDTDPWCRGYRAALEETGCPELLCVQGDGFGERERDFLRVNRCDAVIMGGRWMRRIAAQDIHAAAGLDSGIQVGVFDYIESLNYIVRKPLCACFDLAAIGCDSVHRLLQCGGEPGIKVFGPEICGDGAQTGTGKDFLFTGTEEKQGRLF